MNREERCDLLQAVGIAVFGDRWQTIIAKELGPLHPKPRAGLNVRTVREWVAGEKLVPGWVPNALVLLMQNVANERRQEANALDAMAQNLAKRIAELPPDALRRTRSNRSDPK